MAKIRIQKVLAEAGVASRRAAEEMVLAGRVSVNNHVVTSLPCFVTEAETIRLDGRAVKRPRATARKTYFILNKPRGVVCTSSDPEGRRLAVDLVPPTAGRVYCVGRLDIDSTGMLILTNDGDLTEKLTHPRYGVPKTYVAEVNGRVEGPAIEKLKGGLYLDGSRTQRSRIKILQRGPKQTLLEITLREGRNREIRRLLARVGHKVRRLKRTAIGPITVRGLKVGNFRALTSAEVNRLRKSAQEPKGEPENGMNRRARRERKDSK